MLQHESEGREVSEAQQRSARLTINRSPHPSTKPGLLQFAMPTG